MIFLTRDVSSNDGDDRALDAEDAVARLGDNAYEAESFLNLAVEAPDVFPPPRPGFPPCGRDDVIALRSR